MDSTISDIVVAYYVLGVVIEMFVITSIGVLINDRRKSKGQ